MLPPCCDQVWCVAAVVIVMGLLTYAALKAAQVRQGQDLEVPMHDQTQSYD